MIPNAILNIKFENYREPNEKKYLAANYQYLHIKKNSDFPVPSRDVTNQTLPGRE
jgi:hypothetical protein